MKRLIFILLATSLTANAWLSLRISQAGQPTRSTAPAAHLNAAPHTPPKDASTVPIVALRSADPTTWRDQLREAGADESTVRAIIEGQLRQRYRAQLSAMRVEQFQTTWWRSDTRKPGTDDTQLLKDTVLNPLRELVGRDPLDLQDAEKRYDFLPPAKRRLLAEIELDYADMGGAGRLLSSNTLKSDINRQDLLAEERRKDVMAALTPEERAEFDLRFEGSAGLLSGRLAAMNGTEQEFRALRPLLDELRQQERALPRGDNLSAAYAELNQKTVDQIAAAIGPDRALDYLWSGPGLFPELMRFAQERGLPGTTAARTMQLAAETGARASEIHHDATILPTQKVAALQALQGIVRSDLDQLVPESLRLQLPQTAIEWLTMLGEGRYMGFSPSLSSTGSGTISAVSVSKAVNGRPWLPPPRPPG
jgi:hypothetical protein